MSLPSMLIGCSTCSYRASDAMAWGVREYLLDNGVRIGANRELGWCHDCESIAAIESLDPKECTADIIEAEAILHQPPPPKPAPVRFWQISRWFESDTSPAFEEWESSQQRAQEKLDDARDLLAMLQTRKTPARCLSCGSERVIAPLSETKMPYPEEGSSVPLGFIHPECGGELYRSNEGMRIAMRPTVSRYTSEGEFIEKFDIEGYSTPDGSYFEERRLSNMKIRDKASHSRS